MGVWFRHRNELLSINPEQRLGLEKSSETPKESCLLLLDSERPTVLRFVEATNDRHSIRAFGTDLPNLNALP